MRPAANVRLFCSARESCLREHLPSVDENNTRKRKKRMEAFSVFFCVIMCVTNILLFVFYLLSLREFCGEFCKNLVITRREEKSNAKCVRVCIHIR